MKQFIALLLAATVSAALLSGCAPKETIHPVHVKGALFGGQAADNIVADLVYSPAWITTADNTVYQPKLAKLGALLSADSYFRAKDLAKGTENRVLFDKIPVTDEEFDWTLIYKNLGFTDVKHVESFKEKEYTQDTNDSVTMTMAYQAVEDRYDTFIITVRGVFSAGEWLSSFDVGSDSENAAKVTGDHPEWTDHQALKSLDVAKNRAISFIDEFVSAHDDPKHENRIFITGHSRGAALANLIGAHYEKDAAFKSYTYAFNNIPVTHDPDAKNYKTIFNLLPEEDLYIDLIPFGKETLSRYGRDLLFSISENDAARKELEKLKGRSDFSCLSDQLRTDYRTLFKNRFETFDSLYETRTAVFTYDKEDAAENALAEMTALIGNDGGLALGALALLSEITEKDGKYGFTLSYYDATLLACLAQTLAYGNAVREACATLFPEEKDFLTIVNILADNSAMLSGGHLISNSFVMADQVK